MIRRQFLILCATVFSSVAVPGHAIAAPADVERSAPTTMVVQVHADWCGSCKVIDPRIQALKSSAGSDVLFVKLDYTNAASARQANLMAGALGISEAVAAHNGTGTVLVVEGAAGHAERPKLVKVLTKRNTDAEFLAAMGG